MSRNAAQGNDNNVAMYQQNSLPTAGMLYGGNPAAYQQPQFSDYNQPQPVAGSGFQQYPPPATYDEPPPPALEFGEYAPLAQPPPTPPVSSGMRLTRIRDTCIFSNGELIEFL